MPNDRDIDQAYAENDLQETLRWIGEAMPHVVTLAAACLRSDMSPIAAARTAVDTYVALEQRLNLAAADL